MHPFLIAGNITVQYSNDVEQIYSNPNDSRHRRELCVYVRFVNKKTEKEKQKITN